jgi:hypothetical protein
MTTIDKLHLPKIWKIRAIAETLANNLNEDEEEEGWEYKVKEVPGGFSVSVYFNGDRIGEL